MIRRDFMKLLTVGSVGLILPPPLIKEVAPEILNEPPPFDDFWNLHAFSIWRKGKIVAYSVEGMPLEIQITREQDTAISRTESGDFNFPPIGGSFLAPGSWNIYANVFTEGNDVINSFVSQEELGVIIDSNRLWGRYDGTYLIGKVMISRFEEELPWGHQHKTIIQLEGIGAPVFILEDDVQTIGRKIIEDATGRRSIST